MTECRQGQVDLGSLLEALTRRSSLALPFRARQIDNIKLSYFDMRFALFVHLGTFHRDGEHGMRARRLLVHVSCTDVPIDITFLEDSLHVIRTLDNER